MQRASHGELYKPLLLLVMRAIPATYDGYCVETTQPGTAAQVTDKDDSFQIGHVTPPVPDAGDVYEQRLRQQHAKLNPRTAWATEPPKAAADEDDDDTLVLVSAQPWWHWRCTVVSLCF